MCNATYFANESAGQEEAPRETLKVTRAGFEPRDVIDVAVKPTGFPLGSFVVITATPEAWRLKAAFKASLESGFRFVEGIHFRLVENLGDLDR